MENPPPDATILWNFSLHTTAEQITKALVAWLPTDRGSQQ
jgi:hypothetical protein